MADVTFIPTLKLLLVIIIISFVGIILSRVCNGRAKSVTGSNGSVMVGQRLVSGHNGSMPAGGKIGECSGRFCSSLKGLLQGRKVYLSVELRLSWVSNALSSQREVYSSRKIAVGFLGIHDSRAKVIAGSVMVYGSRKIVVGYVQDA